MVTEESKDTIWLLYPMTTSEQHHQDDNAPHNDRKVPDTAYTAVAIILLFVWVFGTLLNGTSLVVFALNKRLRSPTNMFIISLNVCDLLMSFVATFFAMTSAWNRKWLYGEAGCFFEGFLVYFLGMASMYLLCAISMDRYIVIAKPLLSPNITPRVAGAAIALCWLGGFLWAGLPLVGWNEYTLEGARISCSVVWETTNLNYSSYIWAIFFFCLVLPLGIMGFSYYYVFMTIRSVTRSKTWDKSSRIARKNLKVEKRMAKTIAVMLVSYLVCWMPYTIFSFIVVFGGTGIISPELATYPAILAKSQGLYDPIIYVATNKQFRQAFYGILPCSSLRDLLVKKEEEHKSESEESDLEGEGGGKTTKAASTKTASVPAAAKEDSKKGGGTAFKNTVCPVKEESSQGAEETVVEDLETTHANVANKVGKGEEVELHEYPASTSKA